MVSGWMSYQSFGLKSLHTFLSAGLRVVWVPRNDKHLTRFFYMGGIE